MAKFELHGLLKMTLAVAIALQIMAPVEAATADISWDYSKNYQCCRHYYILGSDLYYTGACIAGVDQAHCHS